MKKPSEQILEMWKKEGWKYEESDNGFAFSIDYPFKLKTPLEEMEVIRTITVFFENQEDKNYYYISTQVHTKKKDTTVHEYLYVEMREHMMIHKTLIDLGWIEEENKEENKEITLFDF